MVGLNFLHSPLELLGFLLVKVEDVTELDHRCMLGADAIKVAIEGTETFLRSFHRLIQLLALCSEFLQSRAITEFAWLVLRRWSYIMDCCCTLSFHPG